MKNGFWIFLAVFVALGGSWCGFVLAPELQLGGAKQTTILRLGAPARRIRVCRFIAPTAAPPVTPHRSGRPASRAK